MFRSKQYRVLVEISEETFPEDRDQFMQTMVVGIFNDRCGFYGGVGIHGMTDMICLSVMEYKVCIRIVSGCIHTYLSEVGKECGKYVCGLC
jgi:hypothetical protein